MLVDFARHRSEGPIARASEFFNYLRTEKGVRQQYPPVTCTRAARGIFPSMARTETQCTNQCRVGEQSGSFWTARGMQYLQHKRTV